MNFEYKVFFVGMDKTKWKYKKYMFFVIRKIYTRKKKNYNVKILSKIHSKITSFFVVFAIKSS